MDWAGLLRLGLHELRLSPEAFWALTPVELLVASGRAPGAAPMTRAALADLARAYPDTERKHDGE